MRITIVDSFLAVDRGYDPHTARETFPPQVGCWALKISGSLSTPRLADPAVIELVILDCRALSRL